jgi:uncharacterized protein YoxC
MLTVILGIATAVIMIYLIVNISAQRKFTKETTRLIKSMDKNK